VLFSVLAFGKPGNMLSARIQSDLPRFAMPVFTQTGSLQMRQLWQQMPCAEVICGKAAFCSVAVLLLSVPLPITAPLVLSILPILAKLLLSMC
jgi:hypothetical protein